MGQLRCWTVTHAGEWLAGYSVVFALSENEAREMIDKFLNGKTWSNKEKYEIREIPIAAGVHMLWDGNY